MEKLLYIHNNFIAKKGSLNTTLLQIFSMCNSFSKAGFDVILAMEGNDSTFRTDIDCFAEDSFKHKLFFRTIHWNRKSRKNLLNRLLIIPQIKVLLDKEKPDLVFTREPIFLRTILKKSFLVIYESHNGKLHNRSLLAHLFILNEIKQASKNKNFLCLFSISQALLNFWKNKGVPEIKLFAWHDGFDADLFENILSKKTARENLGLLQNKNIIVYAGGLYPDREIENILKLAKNNPELLFIIIGGPDKNKILFEMNASRGLITNIQFTGLIPHIKIPEYLYAADILLALWSKKVPTINYCSPLKLFEYMASGRLILTHRFPTISEVLEDNIDAIFCEPDDFHSLKTKLGEALLKYRNKDYGDSARRKAFELYSWDTRVKKLLEFIAEK